jgi:hemerythrin
MLKWDETMTTGIANLDEQHKWLIEQFNGLLVAVAEGHEYEEIGKMLDSLQFYAKWHFEREEHCMETYRCPIAEKNRQSHQAFTTHFDHLYHHYQTTALDQQLLYSTITELAEWINEHIRGIDTHLNRCIGDQPMLP